MIAPFEELETAAWLPEGCGQALLEAVRRTGCPSPSSFGVEWPGGLIGPEPGRSGVPCPPSLVLCLLQFAARLGEELNRRSQEGALRLEGMQLRYSEDTPPKGAELGFHQDRGGYLRTTTALVGSGSVYRDSEGRKVSVGPGRTFVLTSLARERATSGAAPATWHVPPSSAEPRLALLLDFSSGEPGP